MNGFIIAAFVIVALLAIVALVGAVRSREAGRAIGELAGETIKRDKVARKRAAASTEPEVTGAEIEQAAILARREEGQIAPVQAAPQWVEADPETFGVTRRQFVNRSVFALMLVGISSFGVAIIAFLWPAGSGGFGSRIRVGKISDVIAEVRGSNGFLYRADGRMWITEYPSAALAKAEASYSEPELTGMRAGLIAMWQVCPHLGCRVPECVSSQWFECPCHGSQYNRVGEVKGGPAPRGMDRFAMEIAGDVFVVNTGAIIQGPPIGTNTTGQEAEGPHCIGDGGH